MSGAIELWFFRDLTDEQRLKLFGLFGLPVDEIGKVHGRQTIALRHIIQKLVAMVQGKAIASEEPDGDLEYVCDTCATPGYGPDAKCSCTTIKASGTTEDQP